MQMTKQISEGGIHLGFESQRGRPQKSKTGLLVASQKGLMSSKNSKKRKKIESLTFSGVLVESVHARVEHEHVGRQEVGRHVDPNGS